MQPHVYIITVNYNNAADTTLFLASLQSDISISFSCIVIDNSSDPASSKAVQGMLAQEADAGKKVYFSSENSINVARFRAADFIHIICANRGFAAANNIALSQIINNTNFSKEDFL